MNQEILIQTVKKLMQPSKGILAIDESLNTSAKRFEKLGIPHTAESRRKYRELLITAPGIEQYISGYILFDETIRQSTPSGESFVSILKSKGIEVGIKVDMGMESFNEHEGEKITKGLRGLPERLLEYKKLGATFTKWRAAYTIGEHTPSEECMKANAEIFAAYATLCQQHGLVPIVEPEILMDGNHTMEKCYKATARNLEIIGASLTAATVFMPGLILKISMVLPGKDSGIRVYNEEVAQHTIRCLKEKVPETIGGIVFLSGGQDIEEATLNLNAMQSFGPLPWPLTFSYGRAIQNPALKSWAAIPGDIALAQSLLLAAARNNSLASIGQYPKKKKAVET